MQAAADEAVERAFNAGTILRTHVMRPTWHFVAPADIRWMLELTAPRVHVVNAYMYRQLELDGALFLRSHAVIVKALQGGRHLTRAELGSALAQAGITAGGMRLGYILHHAELDALVCSGPRRGKQFTYTLLDERAPMARTFARDEALAELTRRYYTGHGPATIKDFAWWSGLTAADVKAGLHMAASHLTREELDGQAFWSSASTPPASAPTRAAFLLPTYDEFVIGYSSFDKSRTAGHDLQGNVVFDSMVLVGGRISGSWRRTFKKGAVAIEFAPFAPWTAAEREAVTAAAGRYGEFIGMPVRTSFNPENDII